jgi:cytochrome c oxidase subunit 3
MLGGINTVVLIGSSLTMAFAVRAAQTGQQRATIVYLLLTMALGLTFLVIKFFEYKHKFELNHVPGPNFRFEGALAPQVEIFLSLYFALTGLHALHMIIGFGIMTVILVMAVRGRFSPQWYTPVELAGLYWHFVDIVWIFLFPLLYLVDRAHHFSF